MDREEEWKKQHELEAYRALKKTRFSLFYDSIRHRIITDTSLSVEETFSALNSLIDTKKLVYDLKMP